MEVEFVLNLEELVLVEAAHSQGDLERKLRSLAGCAAHSLGQGVLKDPALLIR